jgi:outer membrane protein OmpU
LALQIGARQLKNTPFPLRIPLRRAYLEERGKNMKKLLLATSILAGTAGLAAAEITLSGDARMGFINELNYDPDNSDDLGFTSRARIAFTFSGETDGGLSFGAGFRSDNSVAASDGLAGSVFLSGVFGKISMGDVDGAALAAVGQVDGVGLTGLGDYNEIAYIANGGTDDDDLNDFELLATSSLSGDPSVLYEYTTGNVGLFVSVTNPGHESTIELDTGLVDDPLTEEDESIEQRNAEGIAWAIGANYTTDAYSFGIGYEDLQLDDTEGPAGFDATHLVLGASATFGAFTGKLVLGQGELEAFDGVGGSADVDLDQWAISGTYSQDAISVTGFFSHQQFSFSGIDDTLVADNLTDRDTLGLGASYDLGGGASVVGGIIDQEVTFGDNSTDSDTSYDFGVSFEF